jgi:protein-tyrosine phosphatase
MAGLAAADGVEWLVATPHVMEGVYEHGPDAIARAVDELNRQVTAAGLGVQVVPGGEVYLGPQLGACARAGRLPTLGGRGRHVLVEFPQHQLPLYTDQALFELMLAGFTPIIAHPERNAELAADPERLEAFIARGMLVQVNAPSLLGAYGRLVQRTAERYLRRGWVHFIASDAHSPQRPPVLTAALQRAARLIGKERVLSYMTSAWEHALGGVIAPAGPGPGKGRGER